MTDNQNRGLITLDGNGLLQTSGNVMLTGNSQTTTVNGAYIFTNSLAVPNAIENNHAINLEQTRKIQNEGNSANHYLSGILYPTSNTVLSYPVNGNHFRLNEQEFSLTTSGKSNGLPLRAGRCSLLNYPGSSNLAQAVGFPVRELSSKHILNLYVYTSTAGQVSPSYNINSPLSPVWDYNTGVWLNNGGNRQHFFCELISKEIYGGNRDIIRLYIRDTAVNNRELQIIDQKINISLQTLTDIFISWSNDEGNSYIEILGLATEKNYTAATAGTRAYRLARYNGMGLSQNQRVVLFDTIAAKTANNAPESTTRMGPPFILLDEGRLHEMSMLAFEARETIPENGVAGPLPAQTTLKTSYVYTQPLQVANAVKPQDAVNKQTFQNLMTLDPMSSPITLTNYPNFDHSYLVSTPFNARIKAASPLPAHFTTPVKIGTSADTGGTSVVLPLGHCEGYNENNTHIGANFPHVTFGYLGHNGTQGRVTCPLGEAAWRDNYAGRCVTLFPNQLTPDGHARIQSYNSKNVPLNNPELFGICIIPKDSIALVYYKDHIDSKKYKMDWHGMAMVFSVNQKGEFRHIMNQSAWSSGKLSSYGQNGSTGFLLGHTGADRPHEIGLRHEAKSYYFKNPFEFDASVCLLKKSHIFDINRHSVATEGGTVTSVWQDAGELTASTEYPSSDWLTIAIDGINIHISAEPNTTGTARQGVANILASINDVTYTILINQQA